MPSMHLPPPPPVRTRALPPARALDPADALCARLEGPPLRGNRVFALPAGAPALQALQAALADATDHVNIDGALLEADGVSEALLRRLAGRAAGGLCVNVLFDPLGPLRAGGAWHATLREAGANLCEREPVQRRLMVVDGATAFIGEPAVTPRAEPLLLRVQGPAVQRLQRVFIGHWQRRARGAMRPARFFPPLSMAGTQRVAVAAADGNGRREAHAAALLAALGAARQRVVACTGALPPGARLAQALAHAARRGVQVELLAPGRDDSLRAQGAARAHHALLLAAGVQVYERRGAQAPAEAFLIDDLWTSLGAGAAARGEGLRFAGRAELVVIDEDFAQRFEPLLRRHFAVAEPLEPARWAHQAWWQRLPYALAARLDLLP